METIPYASVVGSLMYVMICTRHDLAYAISLVSRFMSNPDKKHWMDLKWILRYVKGSVNLVMSFSRCREEQEMVTKYVDTDFVGITETMKSLNVYVFTLYATSVSWKPMLHPVVALSTTEAEYISITEGAKEGIWFQGFLNDLGFSQDSMIIHCDSRVAHLSKHQVFHEISKHIDVKVTFYSRGD